MCCYKFYLRFYPPPIEFPDRGRVKYPRQKLYVFVAKAYSLSTTKLYKKSFPPKNTQKFSIHPQSSIATLVPLSIL